MSEVKNNSEVAQVLVQIEKEYTAACRGMYAFREGTTRHDFIATRLENMGRLLIELEQWVGVDGAAPLVIQIMQDAPIIEACQE